MKSYGNPNVCKNNSYLLSSKFATHKVNNMTFKLQIFTSNRLIQKTITVNMFDS